MGPPDGDVLNEMREDVRREGGGGVTVRREANHTAFLVAPHRPMWRRGCGAAAVLGPPHMVQQAEQLLKVVSGVRRTPAGALALPVC
eukprot:g43285.t1